jgi:hypothetical protein
MFDILLRDFLKIKKARMVDVEEDTQKYMAYYEDDESIHLYLPTKTLIYHTVFKKEEVFYSEDGIELSVEDFKLTILQGALELVSMPKSQSEVRINIEQ